MELNRLLTRPAVDQQSVPDGTTSDVRLETPQNQKTAPTQDGRRYRKRVVINSALFFILSIGFGISSYAIHAKNDDGIDLFNPECVDKADTAAEQYFNLDLTFGNFTFTQAKVIDATWDTIIGQGGRLIHGWILYSCVIYPLLVLAMEISSVTYNYYTTLSFSRASIDTLWTLLSTIHSMKSYSIIICTVLTVYSLAYTILFPLLWSAATGYVNRAHKIYAMSEGDTTPLDSEDPSICWVLNAPGLDLPVEYPHIEIGPNFSSIQPIRRSYNYTATEISFQSNTQGGPDCHTLEYTTGGWIDKDNETIWDHLRDYGGENVEDESTENFANIRTYPAAWANGAPIANGTDNSTKRLDWWLGGDETYCALVGNGTLFSSVEAAEYMSPEQSRKPFHAGIDIDLVPLKWPAEVTAQWSYFVLNRSIPLSTGVIPYNSTIWFNSAPGQAMAPFLDIGYNCSGNTPWTSLGNCICYKGTPISPELLSSEKAVCNTAPGYVWGFSSSLVRLGLILEAVWMACCFLSYLRLSLRGSLINKNPIRTAGTMRMALDCSTSIRNDLLSEADFLSEKELKENLEGIKISYQAFEEHGEMRHRVLSNSNTVGFENRLEEERARWLKHYDRLNHKLAERLTRWDKRFDPINKRVDPVSESMNQKFDNASRFVKQRCGSPERVPTDFEVYEDLNWRAYQEHDTS
ncbi:hypothetical protein F4806DRAFT_505994 [Annulohypoxylon nitens]|nr:hypothetical protein F4806DRAFT_505994 [Annulohypoxylon nitens]